ncbi:MAG TPA: hypothetical protein VHY91_14425 [Pirellulales bacterium]|jgi:hypothetical protein|nr:hypothetical protein [Pirellulales bacterium]
MKGAKISRPIRNWEPTRYKSPEARSAAYREARAAGAVPLTQKYKDNVKQI